MRHDPAMKIEIGGQLARDDEFAERAPHPLDRLAAVAPHTASFEIIGS